VVGGDRRDRPVLDPVDQRLPVLLRAQGRIHLQIRIEGAHGLVGQAKMVRRDLSRRRDAGCLSMVERLDGLAGREMEQMDGLPFVGGQGQVAADHHALRHRRVSVEPELGRDDPLVHLARV
jgi:hypothetical protein